MNAWDLNSHESYDVITSNGLNIYESNQDKVTELYRIFFNALKTNAVLISRMSWPNQAVAWLPLSEITSGPRLPPAVMIVPGKLHFLEEEFLSSL